MTGMSALVTSLAQAIALLLDLVSITVIAGGALVAAVHTAVSAFNVTARTESYRKAWQTMARSLLRGLEFMLAADVVRTTISPDWTAIGHLASIALIRTFLNHFLERDIDAAEHPREASTPCPE